MLSLTSRTARLNQDYKGKSKEKDGEIAKLLTFGLDEIEIDAQEFGAITLFSQNLAIPGVVIRDTEILDSTFDGIQFKGGGSGMPDVQITNVRIDRSNNGSGILAMAQARGSARLTNVTITNSRDGDVLIEPGSQFVIN